MSTFSIFLVLIIIVAFLLVLVIMVQNPKGGGLSSSFGGGASQVVGGVKKTGDFLDKSTWTLATILVALILLSNITLMSNNNPSDSKLLEDSNIENTTPNTVPAENDIPANTTSDSTDAQ
ncbi:preprotein translocase subunit SecG [Galbibacter sp. EGI 63066]|uniref:preprotein translocase subunit SecG n=1 Tax=Galbibacter sp. EGI 63066 TaxID=2993559 RepID=UPI0022497313|nr:preprotein translocase subunit SecG [Galbibacter sp. EGI 63066]MCX2679976.1 preprotein translocase subunit SecG [Galbibacter sp. EGI 63066]